MKILMMNFKNLNKNKAFNDSALWLDVKENTYYIQDCMGYPFLDFKMATSQSCIVVVSKVGIFEVDTKDTMQDVVDRALELYYSKGDNKGNEIKKIILQ